ncbi:MAG TPA: prolyl oligopeptidase family serine peptidase [Longimicrobiales bacterium]|nr:prolyl oligopeptidase family serine peptidase [Longimicrobiales bacterium]
MHRRDAYVRSAETRCRGRRRRRTAWALLAGVLAAAPASTPSEALGQGPSQTADFEPEVARDNEFPLTIRSIMRGFELVGRSPGQVRWSDDGAWIYFNWLPGGAAWHEETSLYRVAASGGDPERIPDEVADTLGAQLATGALSPDGALRATTVEGDLYLLDRRSGVARRLTNTVDNEAGPAFTADGRELLFRADGDVYAFGIADGGIRQITDVRTGAAPDDPAEAKGHKAFLEAQQRELFEHIRIEGIREERDSIEDERAEARRARPVYLGRNNRLGGIDVDPTTRWAVFESQTPARDAQSTPVPLWITESGYTESNDVRSKVGDVQTDSRLALLEAATGRIAWLDLTAGETPGETLDITWEPLAGDEPAEDESADDEADEEEDDDGAAGGGRGGATRGAGGGGRNGDHPDLAQAQFIDWHESGSHALLAAIDYDYKTWRLYALDPAAGTLTLLDSHRDEAWVGGPCFGFGGPCAGWLPARAGGEPRVWYVSEATGYAHLYLVDADGTDRRPLTSGGWEVESVEIPEAWDAFLLHTTEVSPFDRHPYRMGFDGSNRTRLIDGAGQFDATPSPDGATFAVRWSEADRPAELFLTPSEPGGDLTRLTTTPTEEWRAYPWIKPEIVRVPARDRTGVPARIYRPSDVGAAPNGAGVIFVHGAGYTQNVHNGWSGYFREYMFHHFLAANGYTVLDLDYRGSAGYGRDWRTAIYRHMGGWDLSDQVDGARWLVESEGVDADRIGIYGGSYGGFITLMALFNEPDVFAAGAALRSVTDWAHYNHWYTSRILNLPDGDEEAYRQSSPIYFAEGLEGHLLIAHGMYDTNVHFSDVVRLAQRLIELGKENWELAVYPVENHSFNEPTSWTDEYRRIFELFERSIGE